MTEDLYHAQLLALARSADAAGKLEPPALYGEADNPLCGDRVRISIRLDGARIGAFAHETRGCLLCEAAAASIGRHALDAKPNDLIALGKGLRSWLKGDRPLPEPGWPELAAFAPVKAVRGRHDCVLLPFEALRAALADT